MRSSLRRIRNLFTEPFDQPELLECGLVRVAFSQRVANAFIRSSAADVAHAELQLFLPLDLDQGPQLLFNPSL